MTKVMIGVGLWLTLNFGIVALTAVAYLMDRKHEKQRRSHLRSVK